MENQMPQDDQPSRDSSISLEDDIVLSSVQSRSDLYTTRQPHREGYDPATSGPFLMPLDLPSTYTAEDPYADTQPLNDGVDSSSLSVLRLERYLSEEHYHERFPLGVLPLGVNKATVKRYLPDMIQNMDIDASQTEATRGTMTDGDERGCRGSTTTTATSSASDASSEPIRALDSNDAASALFPLPSFLNYPVAPSLAGLGQTDMALVKPRHDPASSESQLISPDTCEGDLELRQTLMRYGIKRHERHNNSRVGKQIRVKKTTRMRKGCKD